jgi:glycosyltransferase involved in cell wall biosynthesis
VSNEWIVLTGGRPAWGHCGSQALRMAEAFWALGRKVLYIDCGDRGPFDRVVGRGGQRRSQIVADLERKGFFVMRASQLPGLPLTFPTAVRRWNCARTSARATRFLADQQPDHVTVCHYSWHWPELFAGMRETVTHVYECAADHRSAPDVAGSRFQRRRVVRAERALLKSAKLTVFTSPELAAERSTEARAAAVLPVAVDAEHFGRIRRKDPHDRLGIPKRSGVHPRVGFAGVVDNRFDWAMVRAAAQSTPNWQWIIVGPRDGVDAKGPENMHWVGPARYEALPPWLQHWNVGILPRAADLQFNKHAGPMKLLEYLAAGLPVAATDIPAARTMAEHLRNQVFVTPRQTPAAFIDAIREAIDVPAWLCQAGAAFAAKFTWKARAQQLLEMLEVAPGD